MIQCEQNYLQTIIIMVYYICKQVNQIYIMKAGDYMKVKIYYDGFYITTKTLNAHTVRKLQNNGFVLKMVKQGGKVYGISSFGH